MNGAEIVDFTHSLDHGGQKSPGNSLRLDSVVRVELAITSEAPTKLC